MYKLERLRDMLCDELEKVSKKDQINGEDLTIIDKLAHAIHYIDKIMDGMSYGRSYGHTYSYGRRGRDGDGDGRYSERSYDYTRRMSNRFRDMMSETSNDRERDAIRRCLDELERG